MQILLSNSIGTRNILDLAVKYKSKILLTSTATVYGLPKADGQGYVETELGLVDHLNDHAALNEGKRFAETMFATYASVYGLDTKIARIFRTYGPRMPLFDGHQIPDFVLNALDGKKIEVMGDQKTTTALVYVTDVVDGLVRLMRAEPKVGPINLGSDVSLEVEMVAKKIMQLCEIEVGIEYGAAHPDMIPFGLPNLQKAKDILGWLPLIRLEDGLVKTIDYIRANKLLLTNGIQS
jgi:nucleoside-diphosphate-sugar epimerase